MTERAIADVTEALRGLMEQAMGDDSVYVGAPNRNDVGNHRASLFLFHIEPNAELRNERRFTEPPRIEPASQSVGQSNALPLDLRYLITVFRRTGEGGVGDPNELTSLGQIIRILHAEPTLTGTRIPNQTVRITLEPYPMEEMSRVWGLFPNDSYRTSVVYLASPVFVDAGAVPAGPPVQVREQRMGVDENPPALLGQRPKEIA
jgi:hypothetical protein